MSKKYKKPRMPYIESKSVSNVNTKAKQTNTNDASGLTKKHQSFTGSAPRLPTPPVSELRGPRSPVRRARRPFRPEEGLPDARFVY
jgi:hypothetical protein